MQPQTVTPHTPLVGEGVTQEPTEVKGPEREKLAAIQPTESPVPQARPHAFIIMPFGKKKGSDGTDFDFNAIYENLIKPAVIAAGFEAFRADEASESGDILTDMFQELLLADLCIVDMSIDNANVFYELGIRHAFRKRGVVHIQAGRAYMPFDVFNVRTIPYHITEKGVPDSTSLDKDKAAIERVIRDTYASDSEAIHSPIFNLLDGLAEPDRRTLRTPLATGFWREYDDWKKRLAVAQRQKRIGDILLLTEEIENPLIKEEAIGEAATALKNMGYPELALKEFRKGLEINAKNIIFRREEAFHLNKLRKVDEAIVKIESLIIDVPKDSEAISYLGKIYKEIWLDSWKSVRDQEKRLKAAFDAYHWLFKSIATYMKGYRADLNQYYPGINALTLSTILVELAAKFEDKKSPDPEITWIRENIEDLRGSLIFALETFAASETADYWTLVSLAELRVLTSLSIQDVERDYRKALIASRRNIFYLESSLAQLEILKSLNLRADHANAAIHIIREELRHVIKEEFFIEDTSDETKKRKGHVFLFTGYMLTNTAENKDHLPPARERQIREAIHKTLRKHKAGKGDLAITAGMSAGSEIIFVECCVERGVPVQVYFPSHGAEFVEHFVRPCGEKWVERFYKLRNHELVDEYYQPDQVGKAKKADSIFERNNRWALYSALTKGIDKLLLIAVWDGKMETEQDINARVVRHMVELMHDTGGQIEHINTNKLKPSTVGKMAVQAKSKSTKATRTTEKK